MPVFCQFLLNDRDTSLLKIAGFGEVIAYSGRNKGNIKGRDNPGTTDNVDVGAIPAGTYYLIDRQSGGRLGWARDAFGPFLGTTDRRKWFMLWNAHSGDTTIIHAIRRGNFRLHPEGPMHESDGCITIKNHDDFERLQSFIRNYPPTTDVPGSDLKAYGTVSVG